MAIAEQNHLVTEKVSDRDASIILGYLILSIIFLAALYSASTLPGTAPGDFATMIAFP
jgi:hypothetical protein